MSVTYKLDRTGALFDARGRRFDPVSRTWSSVAADLPPTCETVDALEATTWLQRHSGHPLRIPIGVIGPRDATERQLAEALRVGELLADCGLSVIGGGREGVMLAACEGVARSGGISVGLLPDTDPAAANHFVSIVIATGIGEARNALIARGAFCLIAIGASFGTLSEVALGRQFGKRVIGLAGAATVEGVEHVADAREAVTRVAEAVLA